MKYCIKKLTLKERYTIQSGAVVTLEVNELVEIPIIKGLNMMSYGQFFLRKKFCKDGVIQVCFTPFPQGFNDKPLIVIKNDTANDLELLKDWEIGEVWIWS